MVYTRFTIRLCQLAIFKHVNESPVYIKNNLILFSELLKFKKNAENSVHIIISKHIQANIFNITKLCFRLEHFRDEKWKKQNRAHNLEKVVWKA